MLPEMGMLTIFSGWISASVSSTCNLTGRKIGQELATLPTTLDNRPDPGHDEDCGTTFKG